MARGNSIIVSANPRGVFMEGTLGVGITTARPGVAMQVQAATSLVGGRHTFELYNVAADGSRPGGPIFILRENPYLGGKISDPYVAGERIFLYTPVEGEELNLMLGDVAGTGDDHVKGEVLMIDDGTGEFVATTGTPETEVAQLLETITDPAADQLAWCYWGGR